MTLHQNAVMDIFEKLGNSLIEIRFDDKEGRGRIVQWDSKGSLSVITNYKYQRSHGEHKSWWENGKLGLHCYYVEGKLSGERKAWHDDGSIKEHDFYKAGKKIKMPDRIRPGYILGGNSKFYKD
jgi:antitoxin component YwqK of YwqJK toxin-antitoxin module